LRSECGAESLDGNELSHRAGVAGGVAARWTIGDCEFGMFFGENSSFIFCSGARQGLGELEKAQ